MVPKRPARRREAVGWPAAAVACAALSFRAAHPHPCPRTSLGWPGRQQHACSPGSSTHPLKDLACTELSKGRKLWHAAPGSSSTAPQARGVSYGTSLAPTARHSPLANHCNLGSVVISFLNCAGSKLVFGLLTYKFSQLARRARCFCEWKNCIYLFAFSKSLKPYFCRSKKKGYLRVRVRVISGWICRCCLHHLVTEKMVALDHEQNISKKEQHVRKSLAPLWIL